MNKVLTTLPLHTLSPNVWILQGKLTNSKVEGKIHVTILLNVTGFFRTIAGHEQCARQRIHHAFDDFFASGPINVFPYSWLTYIQTTN